MLPVVLKRLGNDCSPAADEFRDRCTSSVGRSAGKADPVQSQEPSPASPEEESATRSQEASSEQSSVQSTTEEEEQPPGPSTDQSGAEPEKQPAVESAERPQDRLPDRSGEQSPTQSEERTAAQSKPAPAKLPRADAYRLTVTIHGAFGLCNNDEFGSEELYVVVKRLDLTCRTGSTISNAKLNKLREELPGGMRSNTWIPCGNRTSTARALLFPS